MNGFEFALLIPIFGISIPLVAILSSHFQKMASIKMERERSADRHTVERLTKRIEEMEQRILTLQDIVIGGDYEVRRRLERAAAEIASQPPPPPTYSSESHSSKPPTTHTTQG